MRRRTAGTLLAATGTLLGAALAAVSCAVSSETAPAYCESGDRNVREGRVTAAIVDYNRAMAIDPQSARPYIGLAVVYETLGRSDLAIEALAQLQLANPGAPHLECRLAEAHLGAEDTRGAREIGALAAAHEPACPRAWSAYGIALARSRFWDSAVAALSRARTLAPEDTGIVETLADADMKKGAPEAAIEEVERALAARMETPRLQYLLGSACARLARSPGQAQQAAAHLRRANRLSPEWFEPYAELGRLYRSLGQDAAAVTAFERAWALNPSAAGVAYNLSVLWRQAGDRRAAEAEQAVARINRENGGIAVLRARYLQDPRDRANTLRLAESERRGGLFGPALYRLRKLLAANAGDVPALRLYVETDRQARAGCPVYFRPGPGIGLVQMD